MCRVICLFMAWVNTELYALSLHDALPISALRWTEKRHGDRSRGAPRRRPPTDGAGLAALVTMTATTIAIPAKRRSEEHTSELQSHSELVCRLLLEKKQFRSQIPVMRRHRI